MAKRILRCAVVGLGRIGSILEDDRLREKPCTHAGVIAALPGCVLAGGSDTDAERRSLFARRWHCPAVYADVGHMLRELAPDILCIATHPDSHLHYVQLAADHGVPVAVCEKPLADSLASARKIAALHRTGKIKVVTNHERRYSADYLYARGRVEGGRYGKLLSITARLYFGRTRSLMSQLIHDGTHLADIIAFLAGGYPEKPRLSGALSTKTGSRFILARIRGSGVPVVLESGAGRDHLVFEIDLSFSGGRIRIGNGLYEEYESKKSPYYEGFRSLIKTEAKTFTQTGFFLSMMADAAACVRQPGRQPVSSAQDGFEALRFILSLAEAEGLPPPGKRKKTK